MPSTGDPSPTASRPFRRELGLELSRSNLEDLPDGGLLIHDVKLLAEGTWTDSAVGTPLFYPARSLEANAANWRDRSAWSRHLGRTPRDITEKIGVVDDPRYADRAVVGDIRLHGLTQKSRDTIALVKAGEVNYVSVEHGGPEKWNAETRQYEAAEIIFYGVAIVNRGACQKCTIRGNEEDPSKRENAAPVGSLEARQEALQSVITERFGKSGQGMEKYGAWIIATYPDHVVFRAPDDLTYEVTYSVTEEGTIAFGEPAEVVVVYKPREQEMTETKELEAKIEALTKELEAVKAAATATPEPAPAPKELEEALTAIKALTEKVKQLEAQPAPAATAPGAAPERELGEVETLVVIDRETKTVRGI